MCAQNWLVGDACMHMQEPRWRCWLLHAKVREGSTPEVTIAQPGDVVVRDATPGVV